MTVNKPRTIDNMGIETSSRYARDQAALDPKLIEESKFVPLNIEVSVLKPSLPTEFDKFLTSSKWTLWASFTPPPEFLTSGKPPFSFQLIPSLGDYAKQEADSEKLEALEDALNKSFQEGKQQQEEEKERKTLVHLLQTIGKFDRTLNMINARRNQYQRG